MLVLGRRIGEEIVIDQDIRVVVLNIWGRRVSLGVSAPPTVRIDRREIHARPELEPSAGNSSDQRASS